MHDLCGLGVCKALTERKSGARGEKEAQQASKALLLGSERTHAGRLRLLWYFSGVRSLAQPVSTDIGHFFSNRSRAPPKYNFGKSLLLSQQLEKWQGSIHTMGVDMLIFKSFGNAEGQLGSL